MKQILTLAHEGGYYYLVYNYRKAFTRPGSRTGGGGIGNASETSTPYTKEGNSGHANMGTGNH